MWNATAGVQGTPGEVRDGVYYPPTGAYAGHGAPGQFGAYDVPRVPRNYGKEVLFALVAGIIVAALGAPIGLLWAWLAPEVELVQTQGGPYPVDGEPEGYFADDGWFMIIGIVAGVLVAVVAWLVLRKHRGPLVLAGLVLGSVGGSVLAAWLGSRIGYAHYADLIENAPVGTRIFRPVKLRTGEVEMLYWVFPWVKGTLLVQALVVAGAYTALAGFHASPNLRFDGDTAYQQYPPQQEYPVHVPPVGQNGPQGGTGAAEAKPG